MSNYGHLGGVGYVNEGDLSFSGCTFTSNFAVEGGALYYGIAAYGTISSCTFMQNSAFNGNIIKQINS